jgi:monofunctional chorismate mutase
MKNDLDLAREEINICDEELIKLFKRRMNASKKVALYKIKNNMEILDSKREELLKEKNLKILNDKELEKYYLEFLEGILKASKDYQKDLMNK